ncbi:capsule biosynthesis GfcC family protein [Alteromonas sp.]|uniref:capsule biosynthesis GfcC family protein n=1 Tax=Alteromonas sp. TaxID=232 RepID=UPI00257C746E|nr:capsule biosynthesis GfcC family protein [Alteromonas sp.]NQY17405.1 capsule biosynthesis GfcC family protein [Alteromonas sp.]
MKFISTLIAVLSIAISGSLLADEDTVSIMINKQTYQFDRPIRLSSALSIVADNGDWYWPSASAFDLTNPKAEREKEIALSQIRTLLTQFDKDSETHVALQNLYEQVASWTVSTRIDMPISYNRARLFFEDNPMFQPGKYWIRLNGRPNVVHFSGAVVKPGAYKHQSDTSVYTAVHTVKKAVDADRSHVYVIDPRGNIEEKGIAYWNLDFAQLMPGSQVYVPISSELFSDKLKQLNERVAALAVHRVLPQ